MSKVFAIAVSFARRVKPALSPLTAGYFATMGIVVLLAVGGPGERLEFMILDYEFLVLRQVREKQPAIDVALIGIDDETSKSFAEPMALWHRHFSQVLGALEQLGPAAVGLDIVLPDRSYEDVTPGYDRELVLGLVRARNAYPLVIGITIDVTGKPRVLYRAFESAVGRNGTGFVLMPLDADGAVRRFDENLSRDGSAVVTLEGQIARKLRRHPDNGFIDYGQGRKFDYISMQALLTAVDSGQLDRYRENIRGKIVLFGPLMQFEDRRRQPVNMAAWEAGQTDAPAMLLHAQALRSIFGDGLVHALPLWVSIGLAWLISIFWFVPLTATRAIISVAAGIVLILGVGLFLLDRQLHLATAAPLFSLVFTVGARGAFQGVQSVRQRSHLKAAIQGYVSPQVADDVLSGRLSVGFSGDRYSLCVMFVDMRDFTPRSERMTPEALIRLVNDCFEELVSSVHDNRGTVIQFAGDGMMALFGAPNRLEYPSRAAFAAASEMCRRMVAFNAKLEQNGTEPIRIGIGLNSGEVVVGHVGARSRYGYSAMGDTVNVASRLESLTKEVGYSVVVSESVARELASDSELHPLGSKMLKGHSPVIVFGWNPVQANA